jgi:hypothetical protein
MMYHQYIMRTTVDLPEHLLVEAKQRAAERRVSFTRLVEESVRLYLSEIRASQPDRDPPELPVLRKPAVRAGVDLNDTSHLWELE